MHACNVPNLNSDSGTDTRTGGPILVKMRCLYANHSWWAALSVNRILSQLDLWHSRLNHWCLFSYLSRCAVNTRRGGCRMKGCAGGGMQNERMI